MPPKALTLALAADVIAAEEVREHTAVREAANAVALVAELGHLEAAYPRALVAVADVDRCPRSQGERALGSHVDPSPRTHAPIVLKPAVLS